MEIGEEIVIGQLGQQPNKITDPTVAPQHAKLKRIDASHYQITDLDSPQGVTVFGMKVVRKQIKEDTPIFLGRYMTTISQLMFDVTKLDLGEVWDKYNNEKIKWDRYSMLIQSIRMLSGPVSAGLAFLGGGIIVSVIVLIVVTLIAIFAGEKVLKKKTIRMGELTNKLQQEYVCHHCHKYLGMTPYPVLKQRQYCPHCGCPL